MIESRCYVARDIGLLGDSKTDVEWNPASLIDVCKATRLDVGLHYNKQTTRSQMVQRALGGKKRNITAEMRGRYFLESGLISS